MKLYHYTCSHAADKIRHSRWLVPHPQVQFADKPELIWLTDLDVPDRLGLTSYSLKCDRMEHRVTVAVQDHEVQRWVDYARTLPRSQRAIVEDCDGVMPMHWYVATVPVAVLEVA